MAEAGSVGRVAETAWIRHFSGLARPGPTDSRYRRCSSRSSTRTAASRTSRSAATPATASGSRRSRSRSPRRRPCSCSTSTPRRACWPDDVRVRHLLSHTSGFDSELGGPGALRRRRRRARARPSRSFPACAGSLGVGRGLLVRELGLLARRLADRAGRRHDLRGGGHRARPAPAGLSSTDFGEPSLAGTGADAARTPYPRARRPSGGLVSHAADVAALRALAARERRGRRSCDSLRRLWPAASVYGFGFAGERVGGVEVWGHAGSYGGFQSALLLVPGARRRVRRADEQRHGQAGAARDRGSVARARARRAARRPADGRACTRRPRRLHRRLREQRARPRPSRWAAAGCSSSFGGGDEPVEVTARAVGPATVRDRRRRLRPRLVRLPAPGAGPLRQRARSTRV